MLSMLSLRLLLFLACRANWLMEEELYGSVVNSGGTAVKRIKSQFSEKTDLVSKYA